MEIMCPDHQILSVYLDKELPSPWKEKMEEHLSSCPDCRKLMERYTAVSGVISPGDDGCADYINTAKDRVWENLSRLQVNEKRTHPHAWKTSVSLPLPAAIAAALVIAVLAAYVGGPLVHKTAPGMNTIANLDAQGIIPVSDISRIIQYLDAQENSSNMVIIRLPDTQNFMSSGEPTIIRAADYSRGEIYR